MCLAELGRGGDDGGDDGDANPTTSAENENANKRDRPSSTKREYASKASGALSRMAFLAVGTRDVCSLVELLLYDLLAREGSVPDLRGGEENSRLVREGFVKLPSQGDIPQSETLRAAASSGMRIRRLRQELNSAAHSRGFLLCSSFLMDPTAITLSMVRRGKEGDLAELKKLAAKRSDARVLKLVAKRQQDPAKAAPVESVVSLSNNWVYLPKEGEEVGEIRELELAIQKASVGATIKRLKGKVGMKKEESEAKQISFLPVSTGRL